MSEPGAGTDVLGMATTATESGEHYVLNGAKMWILTAIDDDTLGDVFLVYARTGNSRNEIGQFIVERYARVQSRSALERKAWYARIVDSRVGFRQLQVQNESHR